MKLALILRKARTSRAYHQAMTPSMICLRYFEYEILKHCRVGPRVEIEIC